MTVDQLAVGYYSTSVAVGYYSTSHVAARTSSDLFSFFMTVDQLAVTTRRPAGGTLVSDWSRVIT